MPLDTCPTYSPTAVLSAGAHCVPSDPFFAIAEIAPGPVCAGMGLGAAHNRNLRVEKHSHICSMCC